jgi:small subunit ribosomal protein S6
MRNYELAYIADPELDEDGRNELETKVKSWIEAAGGKVLKVDRWDKRRLAYPIKKHQDGYYYFVQAEMQPESGHAIERDLRINEQILRFMIVAKESS